MSKVRRYFKLPIETEHGEGLQYIEFTDGWATRQFEVFDTIVLVGGINSMLADQPLDVVGLLDEPQWEIAKEEFESAWKNNVEKQ